MFLGNEASPVPASALAIDGKPGVRASYAKFDMDAMMNPAYKPTYLATRVEPGIDGSAPLPAEAASVKPIVIHWDTTLTPPETGDYNLGMAADGTFRLRVDDKDLTFSWQGSSKEPKVGRIHLEAGRPAKLSVDYIPGEQVTPAAHLVWSKIDLKPSPAAVAVAKDADVVVAVVGITSELEGEEMQVNEEGFKGGDRTSIDLPKPEEELLEAVASTGKPLVVVLTNGSALGVNWANAHANAILDAFYPGEEGGAAVAETLSGKNNPAGRLPVTFYTGVSQLPAFEDYSMKGRTYRYFEGTPLYPFGYGMSYTTFSYSALTGPHDAVQAGSPVPIDIVVTNTGKKAGDEVAELYLKFPDVAGAPIRALRAFQRVHLEAGASRKLHFELQPRDLSMVTEAGDPIVAEGQYVVSVGGGQPHTGTQVISGSFNINGTLTLPE
jgi:beta-glucosidase